MLKYLITDPTFYSNNPILLQKRLTKILKKHSPDIACFRDKSSYSKKRLAKAFVRCCKKEKIKNISINSDIRLAIFSKVNSIHLTSKDFDKIKIARRNRLFCIISCHNEKEIKLAKKLRADAITYSPIFHSPNKGEPKGVENLKIIVKKYNIPTIALGGITSKDDINKIRQTRVKGFASIRYFF